MQSRTFYKNTALKIDSETLNIPITIFILRKWGLVLWLCCKLRASLVFKRFLISSDSSLWVLSRSLTMLFSFSLFHWCLMESEFYFQYLVIVVQDLIKMQKCWVWNNYNENNTSTLFVIIILKMSSLKQLRLVLDCYTLIKWCRR